LYRDVVSRNEIRDILTLQNLAVYLMTNIGRLTSATNLKRNFDVSQDKWNITPRLCWKAT